MGSLHFYTLFSPFFYLKNPAMYPVPAFDAFELTFNVLELALDVFKLVFDVFKLTFDVFKLTFNAFKQTLGVTTPARRGFGPRPMMIQQRSIAQRPRTSPMKWIHDVPLVCPKRHDHWQGWTWQTWLDSSKTHPRLLRPQGSCCSAPTHFILR